MKYVIGMFLILGILDSSLAGNIDLYATTSSPAKYGTLNSKSKLDGTTLTDVKCGYFLTKGKAFKTWGPSLTFFIEDSSGNRSILYRMLNGTRNLDPIQTLHSTTATDTLINNKTKTYSLLYKQYSGMLSSVIPSQKNVLSIERKLNLDPYYKSENDLAILTVSYKVDVLRKSGLGYNQLTNISCSFDKNVVR